MSPLIDPLPNGLPPWSVDCSDPLAASVVGRLFALLQWLPHSLYLPPGSDTVETLLWRHLSNAFSTLQKNNSSHVLPVITTKIGEFRPFCLLLGPLQG
jgi:hypothetical protein